MVKRISILLLVLISTLTVSAKQIKLLTIGNSFSDDAVEHYLYGLSEASGDTIVIGNLYIGGCSLERHYNNSLNNSKDYSYRKIVDGVRVITDGYDLIKGITDEPWDYISFQQVSQLSGQYDTYFPYLEDLMKFTKKHATNPKVEFVLHATWAYAQASKHPGFIDYGNSQYRMYEAIVDASSRAAKRVGIDIIIPSGTAIQNGRTSSLGDSFCRDGYHLELNYGRYTASCAWYQKLFGKSVIGNSYVPVNIDPFQAKVAQTAAYNAVLNPTQVTPIIINEGAWRTIEPYFTPPKEYENAYYGYKSPLEFYDGTPVKEKGEWKKRREEIRDKWMDMMGEWPEIITNQKLEIVSSERRDNFTQHTVRFKWTPDEYTTGYLLVPDGEGVKPAVVTVFYEPETAAGIGGKPNRDFAYRLTKRGFITLSIGTTKTTEDKTYSLYYPSRENAKVQPLSMLAYAAANAYEALAKFDGVDADRIGIVGHSYGGKWAMFASCLYDKYAAAVWIDPGIVFDETKGSNVNYWEPWYLGYYQPPWNDTWSKTSEHGKGLYPTLRKNNFDLQELHALMAPRPFLVSGGSSDTVDRWIPLNHSIAVNKLLGYTHRVAMSNRPDHNPNPESNEIVYSFFEWFLK
jgi:hypothetical protein